MRRHFLAVPILALAACVEPDLDVGPILGCDHQLFPGEACVDDAHPVDFYDDRVVLAAGGEGPVAMLTLEGLEVTVTSDDPTIVEVVATSERAFIVRGLDPGYGRVSARGPDGAVLATLPVDVAAITRVEFRFDPAGELALTELAALPGATERIRVVARDAEGRAPIGADVALAFATTGPLALAPLDQAELRAGSIDLFAGNARPGFEAAVRFDALGSASLIARQGGLDLATLPIEIIPTATTVALVPAAPTTWEGWFQLVGLVGADARGVPVAGLIGDFTASPAELVTIRDPRAGQVALETLAPGVVTVTAVLADRTLTTTFEILAR